MQRHDPHLTVRLARDDGDLLAAQRLRYKVFVEELGGDGSMVDHAAKLERDRFDPYFDHLCLVDDRKPIGEHVVGVYRLMTDAAALRAGQFYSEDEYDLAPLRTSGRRLLELGRSCVAAGHRGGRAMFDLWNGLAAYVLERDIEILFGVASFHGTDPAALAEPLSLLNARHFAPEALRVRSRAFQPMDLVPPEQIDAPAAMRQVPALIKAYLRLGGHVGDGAFIDHAFNTTDVCLILDTAKMSARQRALYTRSA